MPKKYPVEVRLFAIQKKREGHSWVTVAEMVRQNFGLDSAPSRRQMTKWVTATDATPDAVMGEIRRRFPTFVPAWMDAHEGTLLKMVAEGWAGKDFRTLMAKWMLWQMREVLGYDQLQTAWVEFTEEQAHTQQDLNTAADIMGALSTEEIANEERGQE